MIPYAEIMKVEKPSQVKVHTNKQIASSVNALSNQI